MLIADSATTIAGLLIVGHFASIALAAWRCRRSSATAPEPDDASPGVTLVRPLRGIESHTAQTLEASLRQAWPRHEVLFCVADRSDPVIPFVERAMAAHPEVDARLLVGVDCVGVNPKLNNMAKGWREARYETVCFADSNLLTPSDYLHRVMATWRPGVGAVSAPPFGDAPEGFWGGFECAFLNTFEARWQYAVDALGIGFCQGKTLCFRKSLLGERGIGALADEPAEDAALTNIVRNQRRRVRLVAPPFPQPIGARTAREVWSRQLRWARLRKATFPLHYAPEIFLGFVPAALASGFAAECQGLPVGATVALLFVAWYAAEAALNAVAGWPLSVSVLAAGVLRDLSLPALWCSAWAGDRFTWHGADFSVGEDARSVEAS